MNHTKEYFFTIQKVLLVLMAVLFIAVTIWSYLRERRGQDMTELEFFKSLNVWRKPGSGDRLLSDRNMGGVQLLLRGAASVALLAAQQI